MKTCTKCGETKPLEAFDLDKRIRSGRIAKCRTCCAVRRKAYYQANLAKMREKNRLASEKWRRDNPDRARRKSTDASRKLRTAQPDYFREWYQQNIERERERARKSMRESRQRNPEAHRQYRLRYRKAHREAVATREREKTYARRALQPYSRELADYMAELVQQPCTYCGATEDITIDHVVPLSRGGKHEAFNLASACKACNCSKCNRLLSEWSGRPA